MLREFRVRRKPAVRFVSISAMMFVVACSAHDQGAERRNLRLLSDLKLSSGSEVTRVEVDKLDDGRVYFRYETKHASSSCDQLSEVRELWAAHVLKQPEAAAAKEIILDPTDPSGSSHTYRYLKQDAGWEERFSSKCLS